MSTKQTLLMSVSQPGFAAGHTINHTAQAFRVGFTVEELPLYFTSAPLSAGFVSARLKVSMIPASDDGDLSTANLATCNCKLRLCLMIQAFCRALQLSAAPGTYLWILHFRNCRLRDGRLVEGVHTWVMLCHQGFPSTLQLDHMLLSYTTLVWLVYIQHP